MNFVVKFFFLNKSFSLLKPVSMSDENIFLAADMCLKS